MGMRCPRAWLRKPCPGRPVEKAPKPTKGLRMKSVASAPDGQGGITLAGPRSMIPGLASRRRFSDLSEAEILALAISSEEDDARIYGSYAEQLRAQYPASAAMFDEMAAEENEHRRLLIETFERRFGRVIPLIRREHVAGYYSRRPTWLVQNLSLERIRGEAPRMEDDAADFYTRAAQARRDPGTRKIVGELPAEERKHEGKAQELHAG